MLPEALERALRQTVRRLRLQRALETGTLAGASVVAGSWVAHFAAPRWPLGALIALGALLGLAAACAGALWPVPRADAARRLDGSHDLHDTLQAALEVAAQAQGPAGRSPFAQALLRRADTLAAGLSASRAAPLRWPRAAPALVLLGTLALALWPHARPPAPRPAGRHARPGAAAATHAQPAQAPLELGDQSGADPAQRRIARALQAGEISRAQAILALMALERRLRSSGDALLHGELLEGMEAIFQRPGPRGDGPRTLSSTAAELQSTPSTPEQRAEQQRFLEEKRRELDKLRSEHARNDAQRRELEQLSRQLHDAAKALGANQPQQAAAQLNTASQQARQQLGAGRDAESKQRAAQQASALRELLQRRSAEGAAAARSRHAQLSRSAAEQRFAERAAQGEQPAELAPGAGGTGSSPSAEPSLLRRESRPQVRLEDHAAGSLPSEGPSRSEVVLSAADRGFASESYRKVYADYRGHAEALLERDQVPSGQRYYVQRYFQLIRPRGGAE